MPTRAQVLKSSLVFSLGRVKVRIGRRTYDLGLSPQMVDEIASQAIADMRKYGGWSEFDKEVDGSSKYGRFGAPPKKREG